MSSKHKIPCEKCAEYQKSILHLDTLLKAVHGMLGVILAKDQKDLDQKEQALLKLLEQME